MKYKFSLTLFCSLLPTVSFAQTYLTTEHVDLNIKYTAVTNTWDMVVRDDDNGIEIPAPDARLVVPDAAIISRPAGTNYDFTGVAAGQNLYVLPQTQDPALMFLGVASYGTTPTSQWDQYNVSSEAGGRLTSSPGRWIRMKLESVTGESGAAAPGVFSAWQDGFGGPNAFISTNDGIVNSGSATDDSIWVLSNGHSHYNWGFSAPGTYLVTFRPSGRQNDNNAGTIGALIESNSAFTFTFQVAVPEPSTALLLLCAPVLLYRLRKSNSH